MKIVALLACLLVTTVSCGHVDPNQSILCDICEFVGDEVNGRILTEDAKQQVLQVAKVVCSELPFFSAECSSAVDEHGSVWVDRLFALFDVDMICAKAHLCKSTVQYPELFEVKDNEACTACMDGLELVKFILESDDLKGLLNVAVNETCMAIGGDVAACEKLVSTIVDQILENLVPMFNVKSLCINAGACPADLAAPAPKDDLGCAVCKDIFGILSTAANSVELDDLIKITINQSCLAVGYGVDQCEYVFTYLADQAMTKVRQAVEPNFVCGAMGSCPKAAAMDVVFNAVKNDEGCKACMDGLDIVDMILKSKDTIDLVHIAVKEICMSIGGDVDTCTAIIDGTLDPIINNLIALFDPASLCKQAGACPALQNTKWEGGIFCDACKDGVLELQNIAEDSETEDMIQELTNILCNTLEIPFCKSVIGAIVRETLQDVEGMNPNVTCANLGACTSDFLDVALPEKLGDTCSECTMIAGAIIQVLENEQADQLIKEAIAEVCTVLPISDCETTMDGYFDQILAIIKNLDGKTLCSLIGLC